MGKSNVARAIAAAAAGGPNLPGRRRGGPVKTLWLTREENRANKLQDNLKAAGAPRGMVLTVDEPGRPGRPWRPRLPHDLDKLKDLIRKAKVKLLVVDPLADFLSPGYATKDEQDMREVVLALVEIAHDTGCAVLVLRHFAKVDKNDPVNQGLGSVGIGAVVRSILQIEFDADDENRRILQHVAGNIDGEGERRPFQIVRTGKGARVKWLPTSTTATDEELTQLAERTERRQLARACDLIRKLVTRKGIPSKELERERREAMIGDRTMDLARVKMRVETKREKRDDHMCWVCYPPGSRFPPAK
jgi:hypothetical protein